MYDSKVLYQQHAIDQVVRQMRKIESRLVQQNARMEFVSEGNSQQTAY